MEDKVFELLDKMELSVGILEECKELCDIIYGYFEEGENIPPEQKVYVYGQVRVLIGFLLNAMYDGVKGLRESFGELWEYLKDKKVVEVS